MDCAWFTSVSFVLHPIAMWSTADSTSNCSPRPGLPEAPVHLQRPPLENPGEAIVDSFIFGGSAAVLLIKFRPYLSMGATAHRYPLVSPIGGVAAARGSSYGDRPLAVSALRDEPGILSKRPR